MGTIEKSVFTDEYEHFLKRLKEARKARRLTQQDVADRLRHHQAFVSRCESGDRRMDVIELRAYCRALGVSFRDFVGELDDELDKDEQVSAE